LKRTAEWKNQELFSVATTREMQLAQWQEYTRLYGKLGNAAVPIALAFLRNLSTMRINYLPEEQRNHPGRQRFQTVRRPGLLWSAILPAGIIGQAAGAQSGKLSGFRWVSAQ
jgi:hypothetical protein